MVKEYMLGKGSSVVYVVYDYRILITVGSISGVWDKGNRYYALVSDGCGQVHANDLM